MTDPSEMAAYVRTLLASATDGPFRVDGFIPVQTENKLVRYMIYDKARILSEDADVLADGIREPGDAVLFGAVKDLCLSG